MAPIVVASTASPFKFPRACLDALKGATTDNGGEETVDDDDGRSIPDGDLALAQGLSAMTGCSMPAPIRALTSKRILHDAMIAVDGVEDALADYAREKMGARP